MLTSVNRIEVDASCVGYSDSSRRASYQLVATLRMLAPVLPCYLVLCAQRQEIWHVERCLPDADALDLAGEEFMGFVSARSPDAEATRRHSARAGSRDG